MDYKLYDQNDQEIIWRIDYTPGWSVPAKTSGPPDSWYPEDGEDLVINSVIDPDGDDILNALSAARIKELEKACELDAKDRY